MVLKEKCFEFSARVVGNAFARHDQVDFRNPGFGRCASLLMPLPETTVLDRQRQQQSAGDKRRNNADS